MTQKKSAKKMLFGKLLKGSKDKHNNLLSSSQTASPSSSSERLNEAGASGSATHKDNNGGKIIVAVFFFVVDKFKYFIVGLPQFMYLILCHTLQQFWGNGLNGRDKYYQNTTTLNKY